MIGLEPTLDEHLENLVQVFREVRRVLRRDGVLFLNYGDAYATTANGNKVADTYGVDRDTKGPFSNFRADKAANTIKGSGLKPKDLMGLPWRVAFALQDSGWWVRSEIVWHKPNPMPESAQDRPTSAHEKLFLMTKAPRYFWDQEAVRTPNTPATSARYEHAANGHVGPRDFPPGQGPHTGFRKHIYKQRGHARTHEGFNGQWDAMPKAEQQAGGANLRNVWSIDEDQYQQFLQWKAARAGDQTDVWRLATHAYKGSHFATFPPALVEPCILAGTSAKGACSACGAPWARCVDKKLVPGPKAAKTFVIDERDVNADRKDQGSNRAKDGHKFGWLYEAHTTGWQPSCECAADVVPCVVLDCFGGSGTVGAVAERLGRDAVLIELNPEYAALAEERMKATNPGLPGLAV